ncbi:nicotinate-nucleotide adenylyltransferase [Exiguobacterium antarcticum]|uniref:Probable nicotinate-nucleotide adenylyltransferase n=1 Tax=Exiguobacterium antarcticum TaxID=132920 RepID=A0ABT6QZ97_9BACL|nr:nicotinate-nucleotide adenylyltransferase [Exiguobacterium antarcticum]AFS69884.1 Nicotinate-nucleotide adenylyltransferase [Exiguobacterium antarcticum B7]MDI3234007.1 nicotinate-nucleotide adenylyltransferase [Exiguobacterium antarcticum]
MKIGLMGGTFDPPHIGHLLIAEQAKEQLGLDEVWFLPAKLPPHKQSTITSATKRLQLVQAAIQSNEAFFVSDIEFEREAKSYTFDTIRELKSRYPEQDFFFLLGADSLVNLDTWYRAEELYEEIRFGAVARPGNQYLIPEGARVTAVDMPLLEVSSTDIRQRVARGRSIRYLVPEPVRQLIEEWKLYAT